MVSATGVALAHESARLPHENLPAHEDRAQGHESYMPYSAPTHKLPT